MTFALLPGDVLFYLFSFLHGDEIIRLQRVEKYLHQVISRREYWNRYLHRQSNDELKKLVAIQTTPYRLTVTVRERFMDLDDTEIVVESNNLLILRHAMIAAEIIELHYPSDDVFRVKYELRLPDQTMIPYDECQPMVSKYVDDTGHDKMGFQRIPITLPWVSSQPTYVHLDDTISLDLVMKYLHRIYSKILE